MSTEAMEYRIRCEAHNHIFDATTRARATRRADELNLEYGDRSSKLLQGSTWSRCVPWIVEERPVGRSKWIEVER